jgi:hypothetical protein
MSTSPLPALHAADVARVRTAWQHLARAPHAAATLHAHLATCAPAVVAHLAAAGVHDPGDELLAWIDYVVYRLDGDAALPALARAAEAFGRDYADLHVAACDVDAARTALFRTLGELLGERFDGSTAAAWSLGYATLTGALYQGLAAGATAGPLARAA